MSKEQAAVHLATMDMPFAKRTMDSRLRKNRDKRMKNKKKKKKVPTGPAPYEDVTSMFMVKRQTQTGEELKLAHVKSLCIFIFCREYYDIKLKKILISSTTIQ